MRNSCASATGAFFRAPQEEPLQLPASECSQLLRATGLDDEGLKCKVTSVCKVAEALGEVDTHDPQTVVRVHGLRALGDEDMSIIARYFGEHFGYVKCKVPVICHGKSGQHKLSNFGFIVMSCVAEADRILAHGPHIVDCHEIRVRAYAAKKGMQDSHQDFPEIKVTNVAKALDAVDDFGQTIVVRVTGLRALGDEGMNIVAGYLDKRFGSVKRKVPVICQSPSGQQVPSNFCFIVMGCTAEAEQLLAHTTHVVDCHKIMFRVYAAKHKESRQLVPRAKCGDAKPEQLGPEVARPTQPRKSTCMRRRVPHRRSDHGHA
jgi:hypothetical protein